MKKWKWRLPKKKLFTNNKWRRNSSEEFSIFSSSLSHKDKKSLFPFFVLLEDRHYHPLRNETKKNGSWNLGTKRMLLIQIFLMMTSNQTNNPRNIIYSVLGQSEKKQRHHDMIFFVRFAHEFNVQNERDLRDFDFVCPLSYKAKQFYQFFVLIQRL